MLSALMEGSKNFRRKQSDGRIQQIDFHYRKFECDGEPLGCGSVEKWHTHKQEL